jgi:hypothetical protein
MSATRKTHHGEKKIAKMNDMQVQAIYLRLKKEGKIK